MLLSERSGEEVFSFDEGSESCAQDSVEWLPRSRPPTVGARIIGKSTALREALIDLSAVAPTDTDVLIEGESGVGKELFARAVHYQSRRGTGPLVRVNCASITRDLFESEFFGHVKGAFTGATTDRTGRFGAADGGTIFLDEVGEIPLDLQGKLLRVLQEREFEPVGDQRTFKVDVRVVAATNRDLRGEVDRGRFREDLYYRLNAFPLHVPALRERGDDVVQLAQHFLGMWAARSGQTPAALSEDDRRVLLEHDWPGNIRELRNVVERAAILAVGRGDDLALRAILYHGPRRAGRPTRTCDAQERILTATDLRALEKSNIERALLRASGRVGGPGGAAELLGMNRTTLASRMKSLGVHRLPHQR